MRSGWKSTIAPHNALFRDSFLKRLKSLDAMRIRIKRLKIFNGIVEKTLHVYNGRLYSPVFLKADLLGFQLGAVTLTKPITTDIHKQIIKIKKGKMLKSKKSLKT